MEYGVYKDHKIKIKINEPLLVLSHRMSIINCSLLGSVNEYMLLIRF